MLVTYLFLIGNTGNIIKKSKMQIQCKLRVQKLSNILCAKKLIRSIRRTPKKSYTNSRLGTEEE